MRKLTSKIFKKIGSLFHVLSGVIYQTPQKKRTVEWFKINGDSSLRLNYPLDENSVVFDVGGYEGQWAGDIYSMYNANIYIFEPVKKYAKKISERFSKNNKIKVFNFGLSDRNGRREIFLSKDGSSVYLNDNSHKELIELKSASDFLKNFNSIDLIKINIEGGEYDLLESLINSDTIKKIKNLQVQFHDFIPNADARMAGIQRDLKKTHHLTYQYPFVWENWEINI
jgi:FkbM family methyltransferase